jgi:3-oxoacyl-[acyl-carrier-protein] synthase-3
MSYIAGFGSYLPDRIVTSAEAGGWVGSTPEWVFDVSGIAERRFAAAGETVADMGARAGADCLQRTGFEASSVGMVIVTSGSAERQFPGPAAEVALKLGIPGVPAIDLPVASAGALFSMALAAQLAPQAGPVLVVAAEKMSAVVEREPREKGVAILFGDGAGACLVHPTEGKAHIVDSVLCSDGSFTDSLKLDFGQPLRMEGRTVILQAGRKIPAAIETVLKRNSLTAKDIDVFLLHQANQNLIVRVARTLGVDAGEFYSVIRETGNTSSASMLIAAADWAQKGGFSTSKRAVFAAFGAGFHWGALLAEA